MYIWKIRWVIHSKTIASSVNYKSDTMYDIDNLTLLLHENIENRYSIVNQWTFKAISLYHSYNI